MITFSMLGVYGRLGNQLFQYALVKSISLEKNYSLQIPDLSNRYWCNQKCLLPELNIKFNPLTTKPKYLYNERVEGSFDPNVFNVPPDTDFFGYFQHPKYFDKYKNVFLEEFQPKGDLTEKAKLFLSKYKNPTSIHIRLGDYFELKQNPYDYPKLVFEYIQECMKRLDSNTDYLVFTGGSRSGNHDRDKDFNWCKERLSGSNIHFVEGNPELFDFELIKNCKNNITGWDSTFSWWASYLNQEGGQIFCNTKYQWLPLYSHMKGWTII